MDSLNTLLDRAAGPVPLVVVADDLSRGHRALARSRRRRAAVAVVGVAASTVLVGVAAQTLRPTSEPTVVAGPSSSPNLGQAEPVTAGPFTFMAPPEGWSVQGSSLSGVTFAPAAGGVDDDPNMFEGKLVVYLEMFKQRGEHTTYDGRDFWVRHSEPYEPDPRDLMPLRNRDGSVAEAPESKSADTYEPYTMVSTAIPGRDGGSLTVQYPDSTGLTPEQMVEFLASFTVAPKAEVTGG